MTHILYVVAPAIAAYFVLRQAVTAFVPLEYLAFAHLVLLLLLLIVLNTVRVTPPRSRPMTYTLLTTPTCTQCPRWRTLLGLHPVVGAMQAAGASWRELSAETPEGAALAEKHGIASAPALISEDGRVLVGDITMAQMKAFVGVRGD